MIPAHLRPLNRPCYQQGCDRPATQVLYNTYNTRLGNYCDEHAKVQLALAQYAENER